MKRYPLAVAAFTAITLLTGAVSVAQDTNNNKEKEKEKKTVKEKIAQYDEIIIRKKTDKDDKVVIEIKDGEIIVNGKPIEEFDNENLSIRKLRTPRIGVTSSPFRRQGGATNFEGPGAFDFEGEERAFLGISTEEAAGGAKIVTLNNGSAAEKAGLKKGDIIAKIDNEKISDQEDVARIVRSHKPEEKITITYRRDGAEKTTTATLGKTKSSHAYSFSPNMSFDNFPNYNFDWNEKGPGHAFTINSRSRLGIRAQDTEDGKGVKVLDVQDESFAEKAGIKEDDVITEFDDKAVNSADELAKAALASREKTAVTVKLLRDGSSKTIEIKTPKKLRTTNL